VPIETIHAQSAAPPRGKGASLPARWLKQLLGKPFPGFLPRKWKFRN